MASPRKSLKFIMIAAVRHHFDITIFPDPEPEPQPKAKKDNRLKKYRFPWRIVQLAKPTHPVPKYQPPPPETYKVFGPVDRATAFRADHLSRPMIRFMVDNRRILKYKGPKFMKRLNKTLEKSWDSIYNFYRKRKRDRDLKRLQRKQKKLAEKKPKGKELEALEKKKQEHLNWMATPKKPPKPEKIPRKWKPLEDLAGVIDRLAMPVERPVIPPKEIGRVSSKALRYEPTEVVMRLYHIPDRLKKPQSDPCMIVKRSALRYKCTPRIEKLAQPSFSAREAKKQDEDKYDPWVISKNALKYKASARILEMAKPLERD